MFLTPKMTGNSIWVNLKASPFLKKQSQVAIPWNFIVFVGERSMFGCLFCVKLNDLKLVKQEFFESEDV